MLRPSVSVALSAALPAAAWSPR